MNNEFTETKAGSSAPQPTNKRTIKILVGSAIAVGVIAGGIILAPHLSARSKANIAAPPPQSVAVSVPLQRDLEDRLQFLGQFSAVEHVELRAQVGGILTQIGFKDGDIVRKGALLFTIDPTPYQIKVSQAAAQLESARARLDLASRELERAETLKRTDAGTTENVDQRGAEKQAAQAAVDEAESFGRDAQFDLGAVLSRYVQASETGNPAKVARLPRRKVKAAK